MHLEGNQRISMECDNMDKYEINSKLYVKPTRGRLIVKFFLNIVLFCIAILVSFYIIIEGFSLTKIGELCLAILVVYYYNMEAKPNYQFSILNLSVCNDKIEFAYNSIKRGKYIGVFQYTLLKEDIEKIEYSKTLNTYRFFGKISRTVNGKSDIENELVVYCQNEAHKITHSLERKMNCKVIYIE